MKKSLFLISLVPGLADAASITSLSDLVQLVLKMINLLLRFTIALALLFFLINIFRMVFASGSEDDIKQAKTYMLYGIVALFVMVSVWGLVNIVTSTFFGGSLVMPQLR